MKVEEALSIYEFMSGSNAIGIIGLWFMLMVAVAFIFIFAGEKISDLFTKKIELTFVLTVVGVTIGYILFYMEAQGRKKILILANCIKSECVISGYKVADFKTILTEFHCDCSKQNLELLLDSHPSEFIEVKTDDGERGVRLIDEKALTSITQYNITHLPYIRSMIRDYLMHPPKTEPDSTFSYREIREKINPDFDDEWIEMMVSKYDSLFIPHYDPDLSENYSDNHLVSLRKINCPGQKVNSANQKIKK